MTKKLLFAIPILAVVLFPAHARAHVLIKDNTGTIGAILHIMPDDDPVAGEPSTLFYDIQSQSFSSHSHNVELKIVNEKGESVTVPTTLTGSTASATYTFPVTGAYKLVLAANTQDEANAHAHTFTYSQRVSRGITVNALDEPTHEWAEFALVLVLCGFGILLIVGFNRRREIGTHSK